MARHDHDPCALAALVDVDAERRGAGAALQCGEQEVAESKKLAPAFWGCAPFSFAEPLSQRTALPASLRPFASSLLRCSPLLTPPASPSTPLVTALTASPILSAPPSRSDSALTSESLPFDSGMPVTVARTGAEVTSSTSRSADALRRAMSS